MSRSQRAHVRPSCPSIMIPTRMSFVLSGASPRPTSGPHLYSIPAADSSRRRGQPCGTLGAMARGPSTGSRASTRLLLLIPTTTYRTEDFVEAARTLDVDLVTASDRPTVMSGEFPDSLLPLPFADTGAAVRTMREYARVRPLHAVVPVDDVTTVVGTAIAGALGLRSNPLPAVQAARDKLVMRERFAEAGVPSPVFVS